jgi:hypothetical protein
MENEFNRIHRIFRIVAQAALTIAKANYLVHPDYPVGISLCISVV